MKPSAALLFGVLLLSVSETARAEDRFFGADKAYHFGATAIVASGSYAITSAATDAPAWRVGVGIAAGLSAGAAKEGWDALGYGEASYKDFVWDVLGTAAGVGTAYLVERRPSAEEAAKQKWIVPPGLAAPNPGVDPAYRRVFPGLEDEGETSAT